MEGYTGGGIGRNDEGNEYLDSVEEKWKEIYW